jgi:DNA-directed RNA polymerase I and III subunit RPAC1
MQTDTIQYSGAFSSVGVDNSFRLDHFRDKFRVEVIRYSDEDMEFDMIGVDPALANAFRRILIAEVVIFMQRFCQINVKKYSNMPNFIYNTL